MLHAPHLSLAPGLLSGSIKIKVTSAANEYDGFYWTQISVPVNGGCE